jgi:hypothetical protein
MAFVSYESWRVAPAPRDAAAGGALRAALNAGWDLPLRRSGACLFTILVHIGLLWFLIIRLTEGTEPGPSQAAPTLTLIDLGAPGAREAASPPARPAVPPAAESRPDLSRPVDLPVPEWSMTRLQVPRLASASGPPGGAGGGGKGAGLKQFIGFGDGIGGELLLDRPMLEAARRAAMRAVPKASGTALVFLRVSPSGVVLAAVIRGGNRDISAALRRELVGKRLFQVKSAFRDSALVALPPIELRGVPDRPSPPVESLAAVVRR